jgi:phenylalanyl-tRNA synthetase beta chain
MKFSLNWIKEYVDVKVEPKELADLLTLKSFEVEEVKKEGKDYILDIDILPNRPDCLSHYGLAREVAALTNADLKPFEIGSIKEDKADKIEGKIKIDIKNKDLVPRYSAVMMKDIKIGPSPKEIKEKLELMGLQSINNVVDIVNYVMLEIGQPLHAFDYTKIKDATLYARLAHKGESLIALDEAETKYDLDEETVVISDVSGPLAIGGIKGGRGSGVEDSTHTILIEGANFDSANIKLSSRNLGLITDASTRFSYGVDPNLTITALERAAALLAEHANGVKLSGIADVYPSKIKEKELVVEKEYINSLIGAEVPGEDAKKILDTLGFEAKVRKDDLTVTVPTFRSDIGGKEDIIEEVARVYGYDKIEPQSPVLPIFRKTPQTLSTLVDRGVGDLWDTAEFIRVHDLIKSSLDAIGFNEVYNYSFISDEAKESLNLNNLLELENPMSHKVRYLRPFLGISLLAKVFENLRFHSQVNLFETGRVFKKDSETGLKESRRVGGMMVGSFFDMKGLSESFLNRLGITDRYYDDTPPHKWDSDEIRFYHPGAFALIKSGNDILGVIGEVNPVITKALKLKKPVVAFELDLEQLVLRVAEERDYQPISRFPRVIRDISILVPKDIRISRVLNAIEGVDEERIIQDVDVFDIYEDDAQEKKSIAFHVIYGSDKKTLKDAEVDKIEQAIKKALEEGLGAEIR